MRISFHGAAGMVTGSCHLVECNGRRILIDCGLYQGRREIEEENAEPFDFDPASIDCLLLTHAHLDHCGRIPLLVKRGFRGKIIATPPTVELARLVLLDSAGLQEEEARYRQRKLARRNNNKTIEPLYTTLDALNSLENFRSHAVYNEPITPVPGIRATFLDAGHILGSASILLELEEGDKQHKVLFSGDLGSSGRVIIQDPATPPYADTVVMETTYGDRLHKPLEPSIKEFYAAINETIARGGNVVIPTFALERAQELLYYLREGCQHGHIESKITVFLDSPMAISATEIYQHHTGFYDEAAQQLFSEGRDPFAPPNLYFTRETAESMRINRISGGAVILAGSGMCTGGRVRHHLRNNLNHSRNAVIFVGFAAEGTLARRIIDGAESVSIFGDKIAVKASVHTIGGFSAHADQAELLAWHEQIGRPKTTFLVHGERRSMSAFAEKLQNTRVEIPEPGQDYPLG